MQNQPFSILIIDDEPKLRRSLGLIMESAGYQVITAANGREAIQCLQTCSVSLAFLDLMLPDQPGMDLLAAIREFDPDLPVLILTAHATLETAMDAVRKGARDYLLKPVRPAALLDRVREILEQQAQPTRRREIVSQLESLLSELTQPVPGNGRTGQTCPAPVLYPDRYLVYSTLTLDQHTRQAAVDGRMVHLAPTTFDYLVTLARHAPDPVQYETLVKESQGYSLTRIEAREMAVWHIHELRRALEVDPQNPQLIITVRNIGYRLVP
jgi:DNA-binding response OmpR family regulator